MNINTTAWEFSKLTDFHLFLYNSILSVDYDKIINCKFISILPDFKYELNNEDLCYNFDCVVYYSIKYNTYKSDYTYNSTNLIKDSLVLPHNLAQKWLQKLKEYETFKETLNNNQGKKIEQIITLTTVKNIVDKIDFLLQIYSRNKI